MIEVKNVSGDKKGMKDFVNFQYDLYRNDYNWAPPLKGDMKAKFNSEKDPFFEHGEAAFFVAYSNGKPAGRITAHFDKTYEKKYKEKQGLFGFYESENNESVRDALLDAAEKWLLKHGRSYILGPMNYTTNDNLGFMIKGHDRPPVVDMPWTKDYYEKLFDATDYKKDMKMFSYVMDDVKETPEIVKKAAARIRKRHGESIEIRNLDMKKVDEQTRLMFDIYNEAWEGHWGFVPMSENKIKKTVESVKMIADPRIMYFVYKDGEAVATLASIPDINQIMMKNRNGNMFNPGFLFKFIKAKLTKMSPVSTFRIIIMGVRSKYRKLGLDYLLFDRIFDDGINRTHYKNVEMGWILENNRLMNSILNKIGAEALNHYTLYRKILKKGNL
ncbi:MAG: hypothetical protein R6W70_08235 [bacterium]